MAGTTILICPKCRGAMRTYERNGVVIDECEGCRGVLLDRRASTGSSTGGTANTGHGAT